MIAARTGRRRTDIDELAERGRDASANLAKDEAPASASMPTLADASLLDECIEGDADAWRRLHRKYFRVAASFLRELGVRERDLEDATQEVFLQMFKYLPRFRRQAELSTWLYRLCITQARQARRRARVGEALTRVLSFLPATGLVSSPSFSEDVARSRIEGALSALSAGERAVFVLYEMEGLPGKEIGRILKCPEASVWRRLHYARRSFRRALGEAERPGGEGVEKIVG